MLRFLPLRLLQQQKPTAPVSPFPPQLLLPPLPLQQKNRELLLLLLRQQQQQHHQAAQLHASPPIEKQKETPTWGAPRMQPPWDPPRFGAVPSLGAPWGPEGPPSSGGPPALLEALKGPEGLLVQQGPPAGDCTCRFCSAAIGQLPGAFISLGGPCIDVGLCSSSSKKQMREAEEGEAPHYVFVLLRAETLLSLVAEQLTAAAAAATTGEITGEQKGTENGGPQRREGPRKDDGGPFLEAKGPHSEKDDHGRQIEAPVAAPSATAATAGAPLPAAAAAAAASPLVDLEAVDRAAGGPASSSSAATAAAAVSCVAAAETPAAAVAAAETTVGLCSGIAGRLRASRLLLEFLEGVQVSVHLRTKSAQLTKWGEDLRLFFKELKGQQQQEQQQRQQQQQMQVQVAAEVYLHLKGWKRHPQGFS